MLWVITEADRSSTCVLLPEEYWVGRNKIAFAEERITTISQENGELPKAQTDNLLCMFCGKGTPIEAAPDNGWVPSFWHNGNECSKKGRSICPDCLATHLKFNEEFGDYELLSDHPLPNE